MALASNGAAVVILEKDCTAALVMEKITQLLGDKKAYEGMQKALRDMAVPDCAERICTVMEEIVRAKESK